MRSLDIGATGMLAQQLNVEVISHNIANMNTTAFTRRRVEFQDLLYQTLRRTGSQSADDGSIVPAGVQIGLGVKTAAVYRITEQGNLTLTENSLDTAINGEGYFQITLPNGETAYTRSGAFQLSQDGTIVTVDGFTAEPNITVPANAIDITINSSGEVLVKVDGQVAQLGTKAIALIGYQLGFEYLQVEHDFAGFRRITPLAIIGARRIELPLGDFESKLVKMMWKHANGLTARGISVRKRTEQFVTNQSGIYEIVLRGDEVSIRRYKTPPA